MNIRPFLWLPAVLAGGYASAMALVYWFQEQVMYHPHVLPANHTYDFDIRFEEYMIEARDGTRLNALFFPAENARGTVVYFHGNAGNLAEWGTLAPYFVRRGHNLLIWDYRSFGKSEGNLSYENLLKDAETIFEWAQAHCPDQPLIPYGTSIGSGMAAHVAQKYKPGKVILETPFDSMKNLAKHHFPWLPQGLLLRYPFQPLQWLRESGSEVYMIHGTSDQVIPYKVAQNLKGGLGAQASLTTIPGGEHNDLENHAAYHHWLDEVLEAN